MEKLLLIEDDYPFRLFVRDALQDICEVIEADSGEAGIRCAQAERLSLVLTDIRMPGLSGFDVVMKLRQIPHLRGIPILAMTAYGYRDQEEKARALGFDDFITKPVRLHDLRSLISAYLSGAMSPRVPDAVSPAVQDYSVELIDRLQAMISELQNEKAFTQSILWSLGSGLMILDAHRRILSINPEGRRFFSLFADHLEGSNLDEIIGPDRAARLTEPRSEVPARKQELALRAASGDELIVGFTTTPHRNASGETVGVVVSFRDITDLVRVQKEMEKVNRMATIAEIASAVAHEIRNPLAGIKTMAQSIEENLRGDEENREFIVRIIRQVDRLNFILRGFFAYARPPKPRRVRAMLPQIVSEVKPLVQKALDERMIRISETYDAGLPCIVVDVNQIQQVFLNLMLNAMDAMQAGGTIGISGRQLEPTERGQYQARFPNVADQKEYLVVEFRDTGSGMPEDVAAKIFEPFFTTKATGSGLGLSIVYRILLENNAAIAVSSLPGSGTTFTMLFEAEQ